MTKKASYFINIGGRVQGVGFRYFAYQIAAVYGIKGWVKNKLDGSVEMEAEGTIEQLYSFIEKVKKGPPSSLITEFEIVKTEYKGLFKRFSIEE